MVIRDHICKQGGRQEEEDVIKTTVQLPKHPDNVKSLDLERTDPTGAFKNITDLLKELRAENVEALAIIYTRSDGSTRSYRNGFNTITLVGTLEQLKHDVLECSDVETWDYDKGLDETPGGSE